MCNEVQQTERDRQGFAMLARLTRIGHHHRTTIDTMSLIIIIHREIGREPILLATRPAATKMIAFVPSKLKIC